jgi:hypothetical protein
MRNRGNIATALVLIGIGAWFLAIQISPNIEAFAYGAATWPLPIIGIGAFLALVGLLTWAPGMFIPACIVSGVGGLLWYQNTTGNWESWAYAWALIPGFVGLGILITGLFTHSRGATQTGFWMAFISALVFSIFGAFLGGSALVGNFWPVLVIALGVYILLRGFFKPR